MQGGNCDYCVMADRAEKSAGAIWVGIMLMKSIKQVILWYTIDLCL